MPALINALSPKKGRLLEILHFQQRELKNSLESDIEDANAWFNLLDEDAEYDDFVAVV